MQPKLEKNTFLIYKHKRGILLTRKYEKNTYFFNFYKLGTAEKLTARLYIDNRKKKQFCFFYMNFLPKNHIHETQI